jgi:hypothetical protein
MLKILNKTLVSKNPFKERAIEISLNKQIKVNEL